MSSSVALATTWPSSSRVSPYSFRVMPRCCARSRSSMLWALEPVKYCIAAPRLSPGTTRRSTWAPLRTRTLDLVSPRPSTCSTRGWVMKVSITDRSAPVHSRSTSPQVSTPRRKLPTGRIEADGCAATSDVMMSSASAAASASRCRPAVRRRSSMALRICDSFFGPMPFSSRSRPAFAASLSDSTLSTLSEWYRRATVFGPTPWSRKRSRIVGGKVCISSRYGAHVPVSASSLMRAERSFPMPGSPRSWASVSPATCSPEVCTTSAADRYARILKAFSPLISSRSAMSDSTRAMAALSTHEPLPLEAVVEHPRPAGLERRANAALPRRRTETEQAPPAPGAAHLGGRRARRPGAHDEILDDRRGDARGQAPAVGPFLVDGAAHRVPVGSCKGLAHENGRVADPLEAFEHLRIAVDVPFGDLPVVGPRIVGLAGVAQRHAPGQLVEVHVEWHAVDAVHVQFQRGDAAVERRPVVLQPGGHPQRLRLHVHRDLQQRLGLMVL